MSIRDATDTEIDAIYEWFVEQRGSAVGLDRQLFAESLVQLEKAGLVKLEIRPGSLVFSLPLAEDSVALHLPR